MEALEKTDIEIDFDDYSKNSKNFSKYLSVLLDRVALPKIRGHIMADSYIKAVTNFTEYKSFNTPQMKLMHTIPKKIIALKNLNEIFGFKFVDTTKYNRNYHLNDLPMVIQKFFEERNKHQTLIIEYKIIMNFIQRLMILLCTHEELSFVGVSDIRPDAQFKSIVDGDFRIINCINADCRLHSSWIHLVSALFDTTAKMKVFKFKSYADLDSIFNEAYNNDGSYVMEQLIGNTLKTCLWSVSLSYLYAIRSVYVFCRLFSIYYFENRYKGQSKKKITTDLYYIALVAVSLYEGQWSIISQCAKSFPTVGSKDLKRETKEYLNSHLLSSGVYYLLKMFERAVPTLATQL